MLQKTEIKNSLSAENDFSLTKPNLNMLYRVLKNVRADWPITRLARFGVGMNLSTLKYYLDFFLRFGLIKEELLVVGYRKKASRCFRLTEKGIEFLRRMENLYCCIGGDYESMIRNSR